MEYDIHKSNMERKNIEMCDICHVDIGTNPNARSVHENGKKHKDRLTQIEIISKQIIIFSYIDSHHIQHLKDFLENQCGKINKISFSDNKKVIFVHFENEASCAKALSKPLIFMNKRLKLKQDTLRPIENSKQIRKQKKACSNEVFELQGNFDQQFQMFIEKLQIPPSDHVKLELLCDHLYEALIYEFPDCQIIPFGSSVTGLSFVGSDVDCFVYLNREYVASLFKTEEEFDEMHKKFIKITRKLLSRNAGRFSNIFAIPHASVPIVKFLHIPTNTNCDVSFKGGYGTHNSQLIRDLISLDPRIRPVMMFIKNWAKMNDFIDVCAFSSYALCMLVLFFFQILDPPFLPTVKDLQENDEFDLFIDGWNCGYDRNALFQFKNENDSTLLALLLKFFKFYANFDFKQYVICPFLGETVEVEKLKRVEDFPPSFKLYSEMARQENNSRVKPITERLSWVYVQDPFQHNRNVSMKIGNHRIEHFQECCKFVADTIEKSIREKKEEQLFNVLVNLKMPPQKKNARPMGFTLAIPQNFREALCSNRETAVETVEIALEKYLREVLKCNFDNAPAKERFNVKKMLWHKSYTFSLPYDLWTNRPKVTSATDLNPNSVMDFEVMLSDKIIESGNPQPSTLSMTVVATMSDKTLKISFVPANAGSGAFQAFYATFQHKLLRILLGLLTERDAQDILS